MEIEAKFGIPDVQTLQRLRTASSLGGYTLSAGSSVEVSDTYLDSEGRQILAAGYVCRRREQEGRVLMTVKGLAAPNAGIHRREEWEVALGSDRPPMLWPDGGAKDAVLRWVGGASLIPLFELQQTRFVRMMHRSRRPVAQLSLDDVRMAARDHTQSYMEAEVELTPGGTEQDLALIVACLTDEWLLPPEPRSKFERGLAFWEASLAQ